MRRKHDEEDRRDKHFCVTGEREEAATSFCEERMEEAVTGFCEKRKDEAK